MLDVRNNLLLYLLLHLMMLLFLLLLLLFLFRQYSIRLLFLLKILHLFFLLVIYHLDYYMLFYMHILVSIPSNFRLLLLHLSTHFLYNHTNYFLESLVLLALSDILFQYPLVN
ncbi:MAG: hypothetical protein EGQ16_05390 [Clostridiales bacterium]|nr:hypothetical protein [Clostridiales bacterium]